MNNSKNEPYNQDFIILGKDFVDNTLVDSIDINIIPKHIVLIYNELNLVPNKVFNNWKKMAPEHKIIFFSFKDAAHFLEKCYNKDYKKYFNETGYAPYKSDFFRICFLYKYGGIYSDIDNIPLCDTNKFYEPYTNIKFITSLSLNNNSCAQAIIISTRENPVLKHSLDEYITTYNSEYDIHNDYSLSGPKILYKSIVKLLSENNSIRNGIIRPHTRYSITETINNKSWRNNILLLDEYTPDGRWQNAYMRSGYNTLVKCRYDDYPWFGHNRGSDYETDF